MNISFKRIYAAEGKLYSLFPLFEFPELFQIISDHYKPITKYQMIEADLIHDVVLPFTTNLSVKIVTYVFELSHIDGEVSYLLLIGCLDSDEETLFVVVASIYNEGIVIKNESN